jgi:hypothetical protein
MSTDRCEQTGELGGSKGVAVSWGLQAGDEHKWTAAVNFEK